MKPGAGSPQSEKVRTGTLRRNAAEGGVRRRGAPPAAVRTSRSSRSIVAAVIASTPARTSAANCRWPCRSIASTNTGSNGRNRLPQTRSEASHSTISALRMAAS
jgi:hypothetical protein